jgi:outer membrane protein assembly factor BamB
MRINLQSMKQTKDRSVMTGDLIYIKETDNRDEFYMTTCIGDRYYFLNLKDGNRWNDVGCKLLTEHQLEDVFNFDSVVEIKLYKKGEYSLDLEI